MIDNTIRSMSGPISRNFQYCTIINIYFIGNILLQFLEISGHFILF